jgi:hypothetical protein
MMTNSIPMNQVLCYFYAITNYPDNRIIPMIKKKDSANISADQISLHLSDSSKALAELTANMVYENPSLLKPLLEVSWLDREPWSHRASHVVSLCCCRFPELINPHISQIIGSLRKLNSDGPIRNFLKIFTEVPLNNLSNKNKSILLNRCFDYLSGAFTVGVKVYSMEILFRLSEELPEIRQELFHLIETQLPESSAGFKSRGNKILSRLS